MKPETADYLDKARSTLSDAIKIADLPLPRIAAREAYIAVFHAAQAYIFERNGKAAKTHRGVRSEFARLARSEPRIGRDLAAFLGAAYLFKEVADYGVGDSAQRVSAKDAINALETAERFIYMVRSTLEEA